MLPCHSASPFLRLFVGSLSLNHVGSGVVYTATHLLQPSPLHNPQLNSHPKKRTTVAKLLRRMHFRRSEDMETGVFIRQHHSDPCSLCRKKYNNQLIMKATENREQLVSCIRSSSGALASTSRIPSLLSRYNHCRRRHHSHRHRSRWHRILTAVSAPPIGHRKP